MLVGLWKKTAFAAAFLITSTVFAEDVRVTIMDVRGREVMLKEEIKCSNRREDVWFDKNARSFKTRDKNGQVVDYNPNDSGFLPPDLDIRIGSMNAAMAIRILGIGHAPVGGMSIDISGVEPGQHVVFGTMICQWEESVREHQEYLHRESHRRFRRKRGHVRSDGLRDESTG